MSGRLCISLQTAPGSFLTVSRTPATDVDLFKAESVVSIANRKPRRPLCSSYRTETSAVSRTSGKLRSGGVSKARESSKEPPICGCSYPASNLPKWQRNWHGRHRSDAGIRRQGQSTSLAAFDRNGSTSSRQDDMPSEVFTWKETESSGSDESVLDGVEGFPDAKFAGSRNVDAHTSSSVSPKPSMASQASGGGIRDTVGGNGASSVEGRGLTGDEGLWTRQDGAARESGTTVPSSHELEQSDVATSRLNWNQEGAPVLSREGLVLGMQPGVSYPLQASSVTDINEENEIAGLLDMDGFPDEIDLDSEIDEKAEPGAEQALQALRVRIALLRSIASHMVARALAVMVRRARAFRETMQQAAWSGDRRSGSSQETAQDWPRGASRVAGARAEDPKDDAEGGGGVEEDLDEIPWDVIKRMWNHPAFVKFRVSLSMANLTMALPTFLARALPLISSLQFNLQFLTPSQISLPILAPLLFGGGIVFKSVISNLGYVLPRLGMSIVILWVLWGVNHVVQEAILRLRNHGVVDRRVSNVLVLFVELTASAIAVVTVLSTIGVKISSLLVPFFVAIALAGKDVWHNYFAGFFLFAAQPFRPGDTVTMMCGSGHSGPPSMAPSSHVVLGPGWFEGVCESVDLRYTVLRNGRHRLMVPNSHFLQREFLVTDMAPIAPPRPENARWKKMEKEKQRQRGVAKPLTPDAISPQRMNPSFHRPSGPAQSFVSSPDLNMAPSVQPSSATSFTAPQGLSNNPLGWGEPHTGPANMGYKMYTPPEMGGFRDRPPPSNGGVASNSQHDWNG